MNIDNFCSKFEGLGKKFDWSYPFLGSVGQSSGIFYGKTSDSSPVEVTKLIRKDLKEAVKKGSLPDAKYSVKTNYSSMYFWDIDIDVKGIGEEFCNHVKFKEIEDKFEDLTSVYNCNHRVLVGSDYDDRRFGIDLTFDGKKYHKPWKLGL